MSSLPWPAPNNPNTTRVTLLSVWHLTCHPWWWLGAELLKASQGQHLCRTPLLCFSSWTDENKTSRAHFLWLDSPPVCPVLAPTCLSVEQQSLSDSPPQHCSTFCCIFVSVGPHVALRSPTLILCHPFSCVVPPSFSHLVSLREADTSVVLHKVKILFAKEKCQSLPYDFQLCCCYRNKVPS